MVTRTKGTETPFCRMLLSAGINPPEIRGPELSELSAVLLDLKTDPNDAFSYADFSLVMPFEIDIEWEYFDDSEGGERVRLTKRVGNREETLYPDEPAVVDDLALLLEGISEKHPDGVEIYKESETFEDNAVWRSLADTVREMCPDSGVTDSEVAECVRDVYIRYGDSDAWDGVSFGDAQSSVSDIFGFVNSDPKIYAAWVCSCLELC